MTSSIFVGNAYLTRAEYDGHVKHYFRVATRYSDDMSEQLAYLATIMEQVRDMHTYHLEFAHECITAPESLDWRRMVAKHLLLAARARKCIIAGKLVERYIREGYGQIVLTW